MNTYGVACITYSVDPSQAVRKGAKTTFVYATTDFNDKHIASIEAANLINHGVARPEVAEDEVLIFSYSKDKFRVLKLSSIKHVTSLAAEMKKAG